MNRASFGSAGGGIPNQVGNTSILCFELFAFLHFKINDTLFYTEINRHTAKEVCLSKIRISLGSDFRTNPNKNWVELCVESRNLKQIDKEIKSYINENYTDLLEILT